MRSKGLGTATFLAVFLTILLTAGASALAAGGLTVSAGLAGSTVTISGSTAPSSNVSIQVDDPQGNVVFVGQGTSDGQGNFGDSFTLSAGAVTGTYTVYATAAASGGPVSGSATFTVQQVQAVTVTGVNSINPVIVPYGTALTNVGLPATVGITLSNGTSPTVSVTWDGGTPAYNGSVAGNYTFTGALTLSGGVTNPNNLTASVIVTVQQQGQQAVTVTSVSSLSGITVAYGTALANAGLPTTVGITLSNGTTPTVNVTWDGGTPTYNGSSAGNYTFTGALTLSGGVTNPNNLTASVVVTVQNAISNNNTGSGGGASTHSFAITTTSLAAGTIGQRYNQTISTNNEGTTPYTFTVTSGHLPPGLTLDASSGALGGTPATAGTYTFTVKVQDANNQSASESYTLTVNVASTQPVTLKDITGNWAQVNIEKLVFLGAVTGYPDGTFRPDNNITRAEFVTVLVKALKLAPKAGPIFADTQGTWAQSYISTAAAYGIVKGYDATHFGPEDLVTREQMTAMVVRAAKLAPVSGELTFKDAALIDGWAKEDVLIAVKDGIVHGYPDGTFRPQGYATRAEAVTVIASLLK
ncbi:MAG: S-layer homology domain-containing protein [Peptococcaceae bacterium]|jgi:hypothetical protein|nr:S-layer homology domain-containing protein [Peptococcaceae bacterium]